MPVTLNKYIQETLIRDGIISLFEAFTSFNGHEVKNWQPSCLFIPFLLRIAIIAHDYFFKLA